MSGARCRLAYGPADATVASVKSSLVLPFWYRLTWVVPEKGPLNGFFLNGFSLFPVAMYSVLNQVVVLNNVHHT